MKNFYNYVLFIKDIIMLADREKEGFLINLRDLNFEVSKEIQEKIIAAIDHLPLDGGNFLYMEEFYGLKTKSYKLSAEEISARHGLDKAYIVRKIRESKEEMVRFLFEGKFDIVFYYIHVDELIRRAFFRSYGCVTQTEESFIQVNSPSDSIEYMGLSKRTYNALYRVGIRRVSDLLEIIKRTGGIGFILGIRNCGKKTAEEIATKLLLPLCLSTKEEIRQKLGIDL